MRNNIQLGSCFSEILVSFYIFYKPFTFVLIDNNLKELKVHTSKTELVVHRKKFYAQNLIMKGMCFEMPSILVIASIFE